MKIRISHIDVQDSFINGTRITALCGKKVSIFESTYLNTALNEIKNSNSLFVFCKECMGVALLKGPVQ